jgi:hypothetical protein
MRLIKPLCLALVAASVFGASTGTSTASATEGPFWKVNGSRLVTGETRLLLASAKENTLITFKLPTTNTIDCIGFKLPQTAHMQIAGAPSASGGTGDAVISFSGCTVEGNGEPCEVSPEGTITTAPLTITPGYARNDRMGPMLVLFASGAEKVFTTLKFTGSGCSLTSIVVAGNIVGEVLAGESPVEVSLLGGGTEALDKTVRFTEASKVIWTESSSALKSVKSKLELGGVVVRLKGAAQLLVDESGKPVSWGIFT